jgi:hypothetical protein
VSAPAVRFIWRMGFDDRTFATALIDLAVRGGLAIKEYPEYVELRRTERGTDAPALPPEEEESILHGLLSERPSVPLVGDMYARVYDVRSGLQTLLEQRFRRLFATNKKFVYSGILLSIVVLFVLVGMAAQQDFMLEPYTPGLSIVGFLLVFFALVQSTSGTSARSMQYKARLAIPATSSNSRTSRLLMAGALCVGGVLLLLPFSFGLALFLFGALLINTAAWHLMPAYTKEGRKLMDELAGFHMYLRTAEADELARMGAPSLTPAIFEQFLPYALAFDLEQQWSERFAATLTRAEAGPTYSPGWYAGPNFAGQLDVSGVMNGIATSMATAAQAARAGVPSGMPGGTPGGSGDARW